jgi:hypothetical protein
LLGRDAPFRIDRLRDRRKIDGGVVDAVEHIGEGRHCDRQADVDIPFAGSLEATSTLSPYSAILSLLMPYKIIYMLNRLILVVSSWTGSAISSR